jgi:hypothetical protein
VVYRAGARGAHGLDEAVLEARVPGLDMQLRLFLISLGERVVEHQEVALHVRARVCFFALRDHVIDQVCYASQVIETIAPVLVQTSRLFVFFHSLHPARDAATAA